ncbi:MAG: signal recognition particle protein, partial [Phycisphaerae bacterium]|nr:signal recognition particle protein [Phycisphaerae bacterium]
VEKAQQAIDQKEALETQQRMAKGTFGFDDFLKTMESFRKMGSMKSILKMIPGVGSMLKDVEIPEEELNKMRGIVHSMTQKERRNPDLIEASRRRRIAKGAGVDAQDVAGLVKQFRQVLPMMKQMAGMGMGQRLKATQAMAQMGMGAGGMPRVKKGSTKYNPQRDKQKRKRKRRR